MPTEMGPTMSEQFDELRRALKGFGQEFLLSIARRPWAFVVVMAVVFFLAWMMTGCELRGGN